MNTYYEVIKRPLVTEKVTGLTGQYNKYAFEVDISANVLQIRKAVETLFKVKVKDVRTLVVHGKRKYYRRFLVKRPNWKKAYVTLAEGSKIDLYPGV